MNYEICWLFSVIPWSIIVNYEMLNRFEVWIVFPSNQTNICQTRRTFWQWSVYNLEYIHQSGIYSTRWLKLIDIKNFPRIHYIHLYDMNSYKRKVHLLYTIRTFFTCSCILSTLFSLGAVDETYAVVDSSWLLYCH